MKIIKNLVLIVFCTITIGFIFESYRWYTHIDMADEFKDGSVPFQAIIYDQNNNYYRSRFIPSYNGKHLITLSYKLSNNENNIVESVNSVQKSDVSIWPNFNWSIKRGQQIIAEGISSSAQPSGAQEILLGVVELQQNVNYLIELRFISFPRRFQKMLPQVTIQVESASPLFYSTFFSKYAKLFSMFFAILSFLMIAATIHFFRKNYRVHINI